MSGPGNDDGTPVNKQLTPCVRVGVRESSQTALLPIVDEFVLAQSLATIFSLCVLTLARELSQTVANRIGS